MIDVLALSTAQAFILCLRYAMLKCGERTLADKLYGEILGVQEKLVGPDDLYVILSGMEGTRTVVPGSLDNKRLHEEIH